jgi:two-component system phosphate regulon sensor histidine kinase PhoR
VTAWALSGWGAALLVAAAAAWALGRARRNRTESEASLAAALDGMEEGLWVTDSGGVVIRHNVALKHLLYAGQELRGRRPQEILPHVALSRAVEQACGAGEPARLELRVEGLRPRVLQVSVRPLSSEERGSVAVFQDVTELRRLEKVRTEFVANVSHELRTPITAIRGYAETLREGALSDPVHAPGMVEVIHRQAERLSALVEDLLELSRLESGELALEREAVNLLAAVRRALEPVRQRASSKDIRFEVLIPPALVAQGDERAVEQVLLNLLDNAVKYTPAGGVVRVEGGVEEDRVAVSVKDTGAGIDEKHLPRLFERFYRVDKGRSREMGGTGLGLSIVKHLAVAMRGDVRVSSRPGEGSTFTVVLPRADLAEARHAHLAG